MKTLLIICLMALPSISFADDSIAVIAANMNNLKEDVREIKDDVKLVVATIESTRAKQIEQETEQIRIKAKQESYCEKIEKNTDDITKLNDNLNKTYGPPFPQSTQPKKRIPDDLVAAVYAAIAGLLVAILTYLKGLRTGKNGKAKGEVN